MKKLNYKIFRDLQKTTVNQLIVEEMYEKSFETVYLQSHFKKLWNILKDNSPEDYLFCIVWDDQKMVAVGLIEPLNNEEYACLELNNPFSKSSRIKNLYEDRVQINGWIQLYVKEGYRNQGIALEMSNLLQLEWEKQYENSILYAEGKAILVAQKTDQIPVIDKLEDNLYFLNAMHFVTSAIKEKKLLKVKSKDIARRNYFKM